MSDDVWRQVSASSVHDALTLVMSPPYERFVVPGLRRIGGQSKLCTTGKARVCRLVATEVGATQEGRQDYFDFIDSMNSESCMVVQTEGLSGAVLGDIAGLRLSQLHVPLVVVQGGVRDCRSLEELGLDVWTSFATPMGGLRISLRVEYPESIRLNGAWIRNGDRVISDEDGLIVVPSESEGILASCLETILEHEQVHRSELVLGMPLSLAYPSKGQIRGSSS